MFNGISKLALPELLISSAAWKAVTFFSWRNAICEFQVQLSNLAIKRDYGCEVHNIGRLCILGLPTRKIPKGRPRSGQSSENNRVAGSMQSDAFKG